MAGTLARGGCCTRARLRVGDLVVSGGTVSGLLMLRLQTGVDLGVRFRDVEQALRSLSTAGGAVADDGRVRLLTAPVNDSRSEVAVMVDRAVVGRFGIPTAHLRRAIRECSATARAVATVT